jgi:HPt (histidine-containing phosphotransfer) domain-containing protein
MLSQLEGQFATLGDLIRSDSSEAKGLIHALKGVSGNVGAKEVAKMCQKIDSCYKQSKKVSEQEINALTSSLDALKVKIRTLLEVKEETGVQIIPDTSDMVLLLEEVRENCESFAITERKILDRLNLGLRDRVDTAELHAWKQAMDHFNFQEALALMKGWNIR